jgi:hypothetical protein
MLNQIFLRLIWTAISATFLTMISHFLWSRFDYRSLWPGEKQKSRRDHSDPTADPNDRRLRRLGKANRTGSKIGGQHLRQSRSKAPCGQNGNSQTQRQCRKRTVSNFNEVNVRDRNFSQYRNK